MFSLACLAVGLLGMTTANAAVAQGVTYEIDNLSPVISYSPALAGGRSTNYTEPVWEPNTAKNAWKTAYLNQPWQEWELKRFTDAHYTWASYVKGMDAPSASISFVGKEVAVVGPNVGQKPNIPAGKAQMYIDGSYVGDCQDSQDGMRMRCNKEVAYGRHEFTIKVTEGSFALDHFDVFAGHEEEAPTRFPLAFGQDVLNRNDTVAWDGQWGGVGESQDSSGNVAANWVRATTKGQNASVSLTVPSGTTRVSVFGAVDIDHNQFRITLSPPSLLGPGTFDLSAWNHFTVQNVSMFECALEADREHKLTITNLAASGAYLDISEVVFYKTAGKGGGGLSTGAIAGIAVGCAVAGLAALGLLGWWLWRRRQKHKSALRPTAMDLESDHENADRVEPFHDERPMSHAPTAVPLPVSVASPYVPLGTASSSSTSDPLMSSRYSTGHSLRLHNPDELARPGPSTVGLSALDAKNPAPSPPVEIQHVHHTDGGALSVPQVAQASGVMIEETPPTYNPDWAPGPSASVSVSASGVAETVTRPEKA